ncbi:MAG TPA: tetratricopeptide repeat protein, partial [Anaeromyxobacteraceae bacterium]|nr:tetratricopeptide repeat protein [Anaeromyxobacteraceae bacterium]
MASSLVEKYGRILEADPRSRVFVELARALLDAGEARRAAEICQRGLEHHPDSVVAHVLCGKALLSLGRNEEALESFDAALATDPGNPYGYDLVGEALVKGGLPERALVVMLRGAELHPGDGRIQKWLSLARQAMPAEPDPPPAPAPEGAATQAAQPATAEASEPAPEAPDPGREATPAAAPADGAPPPELAGPPGTSPPEDGGEPPVIAPAALLEDEEVPPLPPAPRPPLLTPPPLRRPLNGTAPASELAAAANFLDLLPTAPAGAPSPSTTALAPLAPSPAEEERRADEAARTYEHKLREELLVKPAEEAARPGFLRRHAGAAALAALVLLVAGGLGVFLAVRAHRRADEARASVEAARKGLARDTLGALREAARVLAEARRVLPHDADAAALQAETAGLLAHDYGDDVARANAKELLARGGAGEGEVALRYLLAGANEAPAAAIALLDQAPAGKPFVRALAGELLLARHDLEGAEFHLEAAARATPPLLRALSALGDLELARGDAQLALERYAMVLKVHPTHPRAALGAAEARLRLGRELPEALASLEQVAADPQSPPPLGDRLRMEVVMARLLAAVGRTTEAERRLGEASARYPESAELKAAEAEVLAAAGDLDRAARAAEVAVRLAPTEGGYLELLARLDLRRGRYRELLAATEGTSSRTLRLDRGIARLELGDPERARSELEATRRDGKMTPEAAGWMALAELASGRREQAAAIAA